SGRRTTDQLTSLSPWGNSGTCSARSRAHRRTGPLSAVSPRRLARTSGRNIPAPYRTNTEAIASYQQAIRLKPGYADAHNNLGTVLARHGRLDEAMSSYHQALHLKSDYPDVHNNLGLALARQGRLDEAVVSYQQALRLKPDSAEAHSNLGNALQ